MVSGLDNGPISVHDKMHAMAPGGGATDGDTITITDLQGEILIEHPRPEPGVTYVSNSRPTGLGKTTESSPMS